MTASNYTPKFIKRFNAKINKTINSNDCWIWLAGTNEKGYGRIFFNGKCLRAHRVAYELQHGTISDGLGVLHSCDNPACCNPNHLSLGSNIDNVMDCVSKGRNTRGHRHGLSKLTELDVRAIRNEYSFGENGYGRLAKKYNVHENTILCVIRRITWDWLD